MTPGVVAETDLAGTHMATDFENLLQSVADRWNGHNDGWGCLSQPSTH
jgi:hypothetical protein